MKKSSRVMAFVAMAVVAVAGTIWGVAYANEHPCKKYINKSASYQDNGVTYWTDPEGRPARATSSVVRTSKAERGDCQKRVGKLFKDKGGPTGYDGGHLIAATLGGVDERYDLVPQRPHQNRSTMAQVENGIKGCIKKKKQVVEYTVSVEYSDNKTVIPSKFHIEFMVKPSKETFQGSFNNNNSTPAGFREKLNSTLTKAKCK